jgi:hypothetical protein
MIEQNRLLDAAVIFPNLSSRALVVVAMHIRYG